MTLTRRPRRTAGLAAAASSALVAGLLVTGAPAATAAEDGSVPGVTLRTFSTGPLTALCTIKAGSTPNVGKIVPLVDLRTAEDFGQEDNFLSQVLATLTVPQPGEYTFRLTSDDGSRLSLDGQTVVDHDGLHAATAVEGTISLTAGPHDLLVDYFEAGGGQQLTLEWRTPGSDDYVLVPTSVLSTEDAVQVVAPGTKYCEGATDTAGDGLRLDAVHPDYDLVPIRPDGFEPMVSGLDWLDDGRMVLLTSGAVSPFGPPSVPRPGELFVVDGVEDAASPADVTYTKVATGLETPMGVTVDGGTIYVSERFGLTALTADTDGDGMLQERTVATWASGGTFHEFAFGLLHDEDYVYLNRSVAIDNGGATTTPQPGQGAGTSLKVDKDTGEVITVAGGLRTPNGNGWGPGGHQFVMDNQGGWLPASKLVRIEEDRFFNHYLTPAGEFEDEPVSPPVLWIPQNEIGNSPSQPVMLEQGTFAGQMLFGDVTYGGLQRAFLEEVDGEYQGAVFRHTAGLEAGINRTLVGPDGSVYVGGIGEAGNWSEPGKLRYGLQKLRPNGTTAFDMLSMEVVPGGFEVTYTQPLSEETVADLATSYQLRQWRYLPTPSYGGPKIDEEVVPVTGTSVSEDRRTVTLQVDGLEPGRVVHLRSPRPFADVSGAELWSTEAWYTLNSLPGYEAPADLGYLEAEEGTLRGGTGVDTEHAGYSGSGFVDGLQAVGSEVTVVADVDTAGTYPVHVRYANGPNPFEGTKSVSLLVNGVEVDPLVLPSTRDWKSWRFVTRDLDLVAGPNRITLRHEADDDGNVNVDVLKVGGEQQDICEPTAAEDGWTSLFDGTLASLDGWRQSGAGSFGRTADCTLRGEGGLGLYWFTRQQMDTPYTLELDWKLVKDDNGGVFIGFPDPGGDPFVAVNRGYEIQVDATDAADRTTGAVYTFQGADAEAVEEALNPVGTWNSYSIAVDGQRVRVSLNGVLVNDFTSQDPARLLSQGFVGIQNHGGGETVYYRDIRVQAPQYVDTQEAEDATLEGGTSTTTEHPGYSGTGFVQGMGEVGRGVTFTLDAPEAGTYPLYLRYANGPNPFDGTKSLSVHVNGVEVDPVELLRTGDWRSWGAHRLVADLQEGANTVSFRVEAGDDGNVNLDLLRLAEELPDTTAPVTGAEVTGTLTAGWYAQPPLVTLTASDGGGALSTERRIDGGAWTPYTAPFTVPGEGLRTVEYRSTDSAGNVEATQRLEVRVDTVVPLVGWTGARTYTVAEQVQVRCAATDPQPGSGVASSTCTDVDAPAWTLGTGTRTVTATATDVAGNQGTGSAAYTVTVTAASLQTLVGRFSSDPSVTRGLVDKLVAAEKATRPATRAGVMSAFERQLAAQSGKALTAQEVQVLLDLSRELY